ASSTKRRPKSPCSPWLAIQAPEDSTHPSDMVWLPERTAGGFGLPAGSGFGVDVNGLDVVQVFQRLDHAVERFRLLVVERDRALRPPDQLLRFRLAELRGQRLGHRAQIVARGVDDMLA